MAKNFRFEAYYVGRGHLSNTDDISLVVYGSQLLAHAAGYVAGNKGVLGKHFVVFG